MKMITLNIIFILLSIVNLVNCVNDVGGRCRLSIDCSGSLDCVNKICTGCVLCGEQPTDGQKCCESCPLDNEGYCGHKPAPECTSWRECGDFKYATCCTEGEHAGKCMSWSDPKPIAGDQTCYVTCGTRYCSFPKSNV